MADNVPVTAGSGTTIAADEVNDGTLGTVKVQYVKLMDGALDGTTKAGVGANGLVVDVQASSGVGSLTESAPASDTASSGLNGRLQRIAQRITSLIALIPAALTGSGNFKVAVVESTVTQPVSGTITASNASGDVAHDGVDSGNPVKIGGQARTTNPTAVASADRVNAIFDKTGKQIVVGAIRELKGVQQTTITSSTTEATVVTAVASTFLDVYGVIVTNTSATVTKVSFKDATSGTVRFVLEIPATETRGFMLAVDSAIPQATVNNNWTATCGTSVASVEITMLYVQNI